MEKNKYPRGWDEKKVRRILDHYETQTADEAAAEDEEAYNRRSQAFIEVPVALLPAVRNLVAKHRDTIRPITKISKDTMHRVPTK